MALGYQRAPELTLGQKVWQINWIFVLLIVLTAATGFAMLYSAANGNLDPWASRQMVRFAVGLGAMLAVAVIDIRLWLRYAYAVYGVSLLLLVAVEFMGSVGMGAQRWIDLGVITLQPSEFVKVTMILALARYFYASRIEDMRRVTYVFLPAIFIALPAFLVIRQPDLGTGVLLLTTGVVMLYIAGVHIWMFAATGIAALVAVRPVWKFVLLDYQKKRVLTYFSPENDPLGAGYHILQSKIALGSGGLFGKGFMQGSQSHLNFLPAKQTDFIFTMLAEEFGMAGGLTLLVLYLLLLIFGFAIALRGTQSVRPAARARHHHGVFPQRVRQHRHGHRAAAGGRHAAAADFLRWLVDADAAVRIRSSHVRLRAPRRRSRPWRRQWRLLTRAA